MRNVLISRSARPLDHPLPLNLLLLLDHPLLLLLHLLHLLLHLLLLPHLLLLLLLPTNRLHLLISLSCQAILKGLLCSLIPIGVARQPGS